MSLKQRIALMMLAAALLLCAVFGSALWLRDARHQARYDEALLQNQAIAWDKLQQEGLDAAAGAARRLLDSPAWVAAWALRDRGAIGARLDAAVAGAKGLRIDVFDPRGALLATTQRGFDPPALALPGWLSAASAGRVVQGFNQVDARQYDWVRVQGFDGGVLAVGVDVAERLAPLAGALGGEVFIVNTRGREVAGSVPGHLAKEGFAVPVRSAGAFVHHSGPTVWQVVAKPLLNPDDRATGALVWLRDVSAAARADGRADLVLAASALALIVLLAAGLLAYLQVAMEPLGRGVGVLQALAAGQTDAALDEGDDEAEDESGDIARGIVAIRSELLNLQTLREERIRTRRQQERLIRDQLRSLADSLEPGSREEILEALNEAGSIEPPPGTQAAQSTQLADLAGILGRMSGLVTNQQNRLLQLLRDLQAAMANDALFASLQQELEIARQMQLSILPRVSPSRSEVRVQALMIPAKEVGGDFYDYFLLDDDHLAVVVADVSGKGVPAAFFMAISRTLLKTNALFLRSPGKAIGALNDQLCAENDQMMFVTVFYGVLHLPTGEFNYVNAGHNPPLLLSGNDTEFFPSGRNMALAVLEEQDYVEGRRRLLPGETLLLYTDGVTEATNHGGALYGEKALQQMAAAAGAADPLLAQKVVDAVHAFEDGAPQSDDVTVVALTWRGPA